MFEIDSIVLRVSFVEIANAPSGNPDISATASCVAACDIAICCSVSISELKTHAEFAVALFDAVKSPIRAPAPMFINVFWLASTADVHELVVLLIAFSDNSLCIINNICTYCSTHFIYYKIKKNIILYKMSINGQDVNNVGQQRQVRRAPFVLWSVGHSSTFTFDKELGAHNQSRGFNFYLCQGNNTTSVQCELGTQLGSTELNPDKKFR